MTGDDSAPASLGANGYIARRVGVDQCSLAKWSAYIARQPGATIYHDIVWRDIFSESLKYRSIYIMAEDALGRVRGILPLFVVPGIVGKSRLVAIPFRDRGGIVADTQEAFVVLVDAARTAMESERAAYTEIKTIEPYTDDLVTRTTLRRLEHWQHSRVDLRPLSPATLHQAVRHNMRQIRRGIRAGLEFSDITAEPEAVRRWYQIYQRSQRNLGLPSFPQSFFEAMLCLLLPKQAIKLFIVTTGKGDAVAATIILFDRQTAIYAYSASQPEYRSIRPNDFMLYKLYIWLIEGGFRTFDMGSDAPTQDGLLRFKRKWLADQRPISFYYLGAGNPTITDSSAKQYSILRHVMQWMPLELSRIFISPMLRYFG